jgi:pimeloyl-ACP methyl ester carboxylesterase
MTQLSFDLLDTVDLIYGEAGSGAPLVLLHGLGSSRFDWAPQLAAFVSHYRTIAVDLRGHGESPKPPGPYRIAQLAADVALLLMRLDARPAHIVSLSLGGAVAQQLALDYPELVRSLVLANTSANFVSADWRQRLLGVKRFADVYLQGMDKVAADVADRLFPLLEQSPLRNEAVVRIASNDPKAYRACLWAIARFDVTCLLELIACPTLVIAGELDMTVPLASKQLLAQGIPNSKLVVIPKSGHATPVDQPEAFNSAVLGFLRNAA